MPEPSVNPRTLNQPPPAKLPGDVASPHAISSPLPSDGRGEGQGEVRVSLNPNLNPNLNANSPARSERHESLSSPASVPIQTDGSYSGGGHRPPLQVRVRINGQDVTMPADTVVAAAIAVAGITRFRASVTGQPRAPLCGMGICMECCVTINGRPRCRSCLTLCQEGMEVRTDE